TRHRDSAPAIAASGSRLMRLHARSGGDRKSKGTERWFHPAKSSGCGCLIVNPAECVKSMGHVPRLPREMRPKPSHGCRVCGGHGGVIQWPSSASTFAPTKKSEADAAR